MTACLGAPGSMWLRTWTQPNSLRGFRLRSEKALMSPAARIGVRRPSRKTKQNATQQKTRKQVPIWKRMGPDVCQHPRVLLPCQVSKVKPTVLLGVSGAGGIFTRDILQTMASVTCH